MSQVLGPEVIPTLVVASTTTLTFATTYLGQNTVVIVGGQAFRPASVITLSTGATGVNGLDVGIVAASSLYYVYAVTHSTTLVLSLVASLVSPSTGPTMPSGYGPAYKFVGSFSTNSVSAVISASATTTPIAAGILPVGSVVATFPSLTGAYVCSGTTAADVYGFVKCNGQTIADATSPMNGAVIPNINNNIFLRGSTTDNSSGGSTAYTPSGTVSQPTVSGTVTQPSFSGNGTSYSTWFSSSTYSHKHTVGSMDGNGMQVYNASGALIQALDTTHVANATVGPDPYVAHPVAISYYYSDTNSVTPSSTFASGGSYTPSGTVSQPSFSGTVTQPSFSGSAATITPPFISSVYVMRVK